MDEEVDDRTSQGIIVYKLICSLDILWNRHKARS